MLWDDIQSGDVVFARCGPWLVTSVTHGDEFGFLFLDCGKTGVYKKNKAHIIVQSPIMRESTLFNYHDEVLW